MPANHAKVDKRLMLVTVQDLNEDFNGVLLS